MPKSDKIKGRSVSTPNYLLMPFRKLLERVVLVLIGCCPTPTISTPVIETISIWPVKATNNFIGYFVFSFAVCSASADFLKSFIATSTSPTHYWRAICKVFRVYKRYSIFTNHRFNRCLHIFHLLSVKVLVRLFASIYIISPVVINKCLRTKNEVTRAYLRLKNLVKSAFFGLRLKPFLGSYEIGMILLIFRVKTLIYQTI